MKEQKHKFLDKENYHLSPSVENKEILKKCEQQYQEWGFDERELWNLDKTMLLLLYERLKAFRVLADKVVDLTYNEREIQILADDDKIEMNLKQIINFMIGTIEKSLEAWDKSNVGEAIKLSKLVWDCWSEVYDLLWY